MMTPRTQKLEHIESKLYRLWTNRAELNNYFDPQLACNDQVFDDEIFKGVDPKGLKLYSSLIEIGRIDLMSSIYPVINELLGKQFKALVLDYFESLPAVHYNLNRSASRFPQYIEGCDKLISRYPFLAELADYEWIELAALEEDDLPYGLPRQTLNRQTAGDSNPDIYLDPQKFAALCPVLNSVIVCRRYHYPIPKLVEEIRGGKKLPRRFKQAPCGVIVYRDPESLDARFLELGEVSLMMLETIKERPTTYGDLLKLACSQEAGNVQALLAGCLEAIEQLKALNVIVAEK